MTRPEITLTYAPERAPRKRVRYKPRDDCEGWFRIVEEWTGCAWRTEGQTPLESLELQSDQANAGAGAVLR